MLFCYTVNIYDKEKKWFTFYKKGVQKMINFIVMT